MEILLTPTANKKLQKISPPDRIKVDKKLANLLLNPLAGKLLRGEYKGLRSLRAWPLRIVYSINIKSRQIIIVAIDYRQNVYK